MPNHRVFQAIFERKIPIIVWPKKAYQKLKKLINRHHAYWTCLGHIKRVTNIIFLITCIKTGFLECQHLKYKMNECNLHGSFPNGNISESCSIYFSVYTKTIVFYLLQIEIWCKWAIFSEVWDTKKICLFRKKHSSKNTVKVKHNPLKVDA